MITKDRCRHDVHYNEGSSACHNSDTITIVDDKYHTGRTPWNPTRADLDKFIKDEICSCKVCGCCTCNYKRAMYRYMQEILVDYDKVKSEHRK